MARLSYLEKETATPDQEKVLAQLTQKSGKIANIWKLWGHSPQTLETFIVFYKALMKGRLDPKLRELAYIKASLVNDCAYCANAHKSVAQRIGVTEEQIQQINTFATSDLFSPVERAVMAAADEILSRNLVEDATFAALQKHLSDAEILELFVVIGLWRMHGLIVRALHLEYDNDTTARMQEVPAPAAS